MKGFTKMNVLRLVLILAPLVGGVIYANWPEVHSSFCEVD